MGGKIQKSIFIILVFGFLCAPLFAHPEIYPRTEVSIGALTAKAKTIVIVQVETYLVQENGILALCRVRVTLKGEPVSKILLRPEDLTHVLGGEFLAFVVEGKAGPILAGGGDHGAISLTPQNEAAFRNAVNVHLDAKNLQARATATLAAFRGNVDRLRRDAVVDLWLEDALLSHLTDADKEAITAVLADKALRCAFHGEMPFLIEVTGRIGGDKAFESLASFLREREALPNAHFLVRSFGSLDRAYVTGPLRQKFTQEEDENALPGQITVLAGLKVVQAFDRIASLASHANGTIRKFAILGLGDLGAAGSVGALRGVLEGDGRSLVERKLAVVALARTGFPDGIRLICTTEETSDDPALKSFIHTFRRFPSRTRTLLLRSALREE